MTGFVSSDPLNNLTNVYNRPIYIPDASRAPTANDIAPAGTKWLYGETVYETTGAGRWFVPGSTDYPVYVAGEGTQYPTIQSALDAISAAAPTNAALYIVPGTYTEDLSFPALANNLEILGMQASGLDTSVLIIGSHTVASGANSSCDFGNIAFEHGTAIFSSAVAGQTSFLFNECAFDVTAGYSFDLDNWTGAIQCYDCYFIGAADDILNNSGGATIAFDSCILENAGTIAISGPSFIFYTRCEKAVTAADDLESQFSQFEGTVTFSGTAVGLFVKCDYNTGASVALTNNSSGAVVLKDCSITSTATNVITGTGPVTIAGTVATDSTGITGVTVTNNLCDVSAAMTAGTITIATPAASANAKYFLSYETIGGTPGVLSIANIVAGTSFDIVSSSNTDTSTVFWKIEL